MSNENIKITLVGEKTIKAKTGQTLLEASLNAGIPHLHACGGKARCSTCRVLVLDGQDKLMPPNAKEKELISTINLPHTVRLACQTKINEGPVKLERILKDKSEIASFIDIPKDHPEQFKIKPLGKEKFLTLFFLDIRNFTPFIESNLPFDVIFFIRKLFSLFQTVISGYNGEIIETAGDELYAVFGKDCSRKKAANGAIKAGKEILNELEKFNKTYYHIINNKFEIGIGIHAGKTIVGEISLGNQKKTTVMGLAVNIASRIQGKTKELNNSLLVSNKVIKEAAYPSGAKVKEVRLQGISDLMRVHLLGTPYRRI